MVRQTLPTDLVDIKFQELLQKSISKQPKALGYTLEQALIDLQGINNYGSQLLSLVATDENNYIKGVWVGSIVRPIGSEVPIMIDYLISCSEPKYYKELMNILVATAKSSGCKIMLMSPGGRTIKVLERWLTKQHFEPTSLIGYKNLEVE